MSEEERPGLKGETPEQDDVEAHRQATKAANDEGAEGEGEDDFEAHRAALKQRPGQKG
jgi:hypothetical protein